MFTKLFERIDDLNTRYKELDSKFDEMIKSSDYVSKQYEDAQKKIKEISTKEASMEANTCVLQRENMPLHQINNNLLYLVLKLKTHQRRLNLVIEGIKEQYRENEDTLDYAIIDVFNSMYSVNGNGVDIKIARYYRLVPRIEPDQ